MAEGLYIGLDLAYKVNNAGGVAENVVVVQDTNPYEAKLPGAANAGKIVGVTIEKTTETGRSGAVRMGGLVPIKAASAITAGDLVNVADTQGRVKTVSETAGATDTLVNVVGKAVTTVANANELVMVYLTPGVTYLIPKTP
ncbi:hypothetical protein D3C86_1814530 [compost metagenome]